MNLGNMRTLSGLSSDFTVFTGDDFEPLTYYKIKMCTAIEPIAQLDGVVLDSRLGSISHGWRVGRAKFVEPKLILCCVGFSDAFSASAVREASAAAFAWCERSGMDAWFDLTDFALIKDSEPKEMLGLMYNIADAAPLTHFTRSHGIKIPVQFEKYVAEHCCKMPSYHTVTLVRLPSEVQQRLHNLCECGLYDGWSDTGSDKVVSLEDISEMYRKVSSSKVESIHSILVSGAEFLQAGHSWTYKPLNEAELEEFKESAVVSERARQLLANPVQ